MYTHLMLSIYMQMDAFSEQTPSTKRFLEKKIIVEFKFDNYMNSILTLREHLKVKIGREHNSHFTF